MERELETLTAELNDAWQKLDIDKKIAQKKELEKVPGGTYTPDTEPKDDDILLPEL